MDSLSISSFRFLRKDLGKNFSFQDSLRELGEIVVEKYANHLGEKKMVGPWPRDLEHPYSGG